MIEEKNKIKNDNIFEILSRTYFEYKNQLKIIKELISLKKYIWKNVDKNENIRNKREKRQFSSIKQEKEFKELLKKENAEIQLINEENENKFNYLKKEGENLLDKIEKLNIDLDNLKNKEKNFRIIKDSNYKKIKDSEIIIKTIWQ